MWSLTQKLQLILKGYPTCFGILLQKELNTHILRPAFSRPASTSQACLATDQVVTGCKTLLQKVELLSTF